jgi:hypothetical protein
MFFLRLISLMIAVAAIIGIFVDLPIISSYAFWIMVATLPDVARRQSRAHHKTFQVSTNVDHFIDHGFL